MPYRQEFHKDLEIITEDVFKDKIRTPEGALEKFSKYLDEIVDIGPFNSLHWQDIFLRSLIYEFGKRIRSEYCSEFISIIDKKIEKSNKEESEILFFFRQEILIHHLSNVEMIEYLIQVIDKYPMNPEFRNNLGHCYMQIDEYQNAIVQYQIAYNLEKKHQFLVSLYNAEYLYIDQLIEKDELQFANDYVNKLISERKYASDNVFQTSLLIKRDRINDRKSLNKKIEEKLKDASTNLQQEIFKERNRIIEILGFFSAIIAFILVTVSVGQNYAFKEALNFLSILGLILIIFPLTLSLLFSKERQPLYKSIKFWMIIALLLAIIGIILCHYLFEP